MPLLEPEDQFVLCIAAIKNAVADIAALKAPKARIHRRFIFAEPEEKHPGLLLSEKDRDLPTGGAYTFTLADQTTAPVDLDATPSEVQDALEGLSNIDPGQIVVTGGPILTEPFILSGTGANLITATSAFTGGRKPKLILTPAADELTVKVSGEKRIHAITVFHNGMDEADGEIAIGCMQPKIPIGIAFHMEDYLGTAADNSEDRLMEEVARLKWALFDSPQLGFDDSDDENLLGCVEGHTQIAMMPNARPGFMLMNDRPVRSWVAQIEVIMSPQQR